MTPVCTCARPIVRDFPNSPGHRVCKKCGHWHSIQHGSTDPAAPFPSPAFQPWNQAPAASPRPPLMKLRRGRTGGRKPKRPR